jgi:hypothetical protein
MIGIFRAGDLTLFSLMIFVGNAFAGSFLDPEMSCADLKNQIVAQQIKKVDDVLPLLPSEYKKNTVLVYDSHALKTHLVSFATPRMIFFNEDGSMILTVSRDPGAQVIQSGGDSIELSCFNKKTWVYEFFDIPFDSKNVPFVDFQPTKNPEVCLKCHGSNPRPILQDYNAWPGFYGSFSQGGSAGHGSIEKKEFLKFIENAPKLARYNQIDLSLVKPNPFDNQQPDLLQRDLVYQETDDYKFAPITNLGMMIQRNMEFRLAKKVIDILKSGKVKSVRTLLAYAGSDLNTCGNIRNRIKEIYEAMVTANSLQSTALEFEKNIMPIAERDFTRFKLNEFKKTNIASPVLDDRGVLSLPYKILSSTYDHNYPNADREAYLKQLMILQAVAEHLGLTSEDISSFPFAPTLGLGHIMRMGQYKDEQFFLGLTEAMLQIDPFVVRRIENNCEEAKKYALEQSAQLKFSSVPSAFMPVQK